MTTAALTLACAISLLMLTTPAQAINKCKGPDGRISYQEAPCDTAAAGEKLQHVPKGDANYETWEFLRERDQMTGATTCFAVSPSTHIVWGRGYRNNTAISMQLAVAAGGTDMSLSVRATSGGPAFHSKIDGSGIKIDDGEFIRLTRSIGSHGLGVAKTLEPSILGQLSNGRELRIRTRMWPYDDLHDTKAIPLAGFKGAAQRAMACATGAAQ